MSEKKITRNNSNDLFVACKENTDSIITSIRKSVPHYHQSITNVQQEYIQAYENMLDSSITLQNEYVKKSGISSDIPEPAMRIIRDMSRMLIDTATFQNKITIASIDAVQQSIRTAGDNAESFFDFNRGMLELWTSMFSTNSKK